mgnify:CR=1 FL=1
MSTTETPKPPSGSSNWFVELLRTWGPPILAVLFIRTFIFEPFRIPTGSMVPTLEIGDFVAVTKFSYGIWLPFVHTEVLDLGDPERGDIIVFRYPQDESQNYIKRVVAIPGDTIEVRNNQILLNGRVQGWELAEDAYTFVDQTCEGEVQRRNIESLGEIQHDVLVGMRPTRLANMDPIEIPEGNVFVMGDNRDNSLDSRAWGMVRYDQIKGKAHLTLFSLDFCASPWSPRGDRFFKTLY